MNRRTSWAAGVSLAVLSVAGAAGAQDTLRDVRAANAAALALEGARQDMLATQREISARQDQANTAVVLRGLDEARAPTPGVAPPLSTITPTNQASDGFAAQMDRLERLTQDAMARSNARVRAVRPASER